MDAICSDAAWKRSLPKEGFTDNWLTKETARKGAPRREVGDRRSGLRVRIEPSGRATWVYYERIPSSTGGKPVRKKHAFGVWPQVTITAARERVDLIKRSKGTGASLSDLHPTSPFKVVVEKFISVPLAARKLEFEAKARGLKAGPAELVIRRLILPRLGERATVLISTTEVAALIEAIARGTMRKGKYAGSPAPTQAYHVLSLLSSIFRYAASLGLLTTNPCDAVIPKNVGAAMGNTRERCLSLEEVPLFWNAIASPDAPMIETCALVGRILLLTGVRKSELLKAKWRNVHLDGDDPVWHIPAGDRKNAKAHEIPLSKLAVSLFEELKRDANGSEFVCATKRGAKTGRLAAQSFAHAFQGLFALGRDGTPYLKLPGGPVVPHDMRRSAKMLAARCEARADWAEQELWILGHAPPGNVAAHYDIRPDPVRFREIMESMAKLVIVLINPAKEVVRFDARGGSHDDAPPPQGHVPPGAHGAVVARTRREGAAWTP